MTEHDQTDQVRHDQADQVRLRLDLAYDGTDFFGWAKQPGLRTVQGELELRLNRIVRPTEPVSVTVAGRTDAGVHARGQVCHVDLPAILKPPHGPAITSEEALQRWLPRALPADLAVTSISLVPPDFDARFSAIWRHYIYRLTDDPMVRDPFERRWVTAVRPSLDVTAMATAADQLLGLHDFTAFCKAKPDSTAIRRLMIFQPQRVGPGRVDVAVRADAFCHSMVRSLVGALVAVGHHRRDGAWFADLLDRSQRAGEITVLPATGLTLEAVGYPPTAELAERARASRQRRDPAELQDLSLAAEPNDPSRTVTTELAATPASASVPAPTPASDLVSAPVPVPALSPAQTLDPPTQPETHGDAQPSPVTQRGTEAPAP